MSQAQAGQQRVLVYRHSRQFRPGVQPITAEAGQQMKMKMRHRLPGVRAAGMEQVHPRRAKRLLVMPCQMLGGDGEFLQELLGQDKQVRKVRLGAITVWP